MSKQATLVQAWGVQSCSRDMEQFEFEAEYDDLFQEAVLMEDGEVASTSEKLQYPGFDSAAGKLWIYPTNYPVRDYQLNIVSKALFVNTLVCLPTGLGKTFVAAVVMYNFYRWYPNGKIVFLAPTKPLVSQQIEACHNIAGIPQTHVAEMTGSLRPKERAGLWQSKRVFFLTPQVMHNDVARGVCPAQQVRCVVFDEAHKALGNHAYCQVITGLSGGMFRVLALSATPGNDLKAVQKVVSNLHIAHIELRSEDSPDTLYYVHKREVETVVVTLEGEIAQVKAAFLAILSGAVGKLNKLRVLYSCSSDSLSKYQLLQAREAFREKPNNYGPEAGVVEATFALAISLCHAYELLQQHGMRSFYRFLTSTFGKDTSKAKKKISCSPAFANIIEKLKKRMQMSSFFYSHPKLHQLELIVMQHFSQSQIETRVMIFSQYRDSVEEIAELLARHAPVVKVMTFVGHAGKSGLTQKEQSEVLCKFREGHYNTLVSTCVGEEGLDIGEVDLIVCFDANKSPIRLVQRMGRTGRKRCGRIVTIVTQGKEHKVFVKSQSQKRIIDKAVCEGCKTLRMFTSSPRMVPSDIAPQLHKMHMNVCCYVNSKCCEKTKMKVNKDPLLTGEELKVWSESMALCDGDMRVIEYSIKACLAEPVLCCKGAVAGTTIGLSKWVHWQTAPSSCKIIGHSEKSDHLVAVLGLIDDLHTLQCTFEDSAAVNRKRSINDLQSSTTLCKPVEDIFTQHAIPKAPTFDSLEWLDDSVDSTCTVMDDESMFKPCQNDTHEQKRRRLGSCVLPTPYGDASSRGTEIDAFLDKEAVVCGVVSSDDDECSYSAASFINDNSVLTQYGEPSVLAPCEVMAQQGWYKLAISPRHHTLQYYMQKADSLPRTKQQVVASDTIVSESLMAGVDVGSVESCFLLEVEDWD